MKGIQRVPRKVALALPNLRLSTHPLVGVMLTKLRDKNLSPEDFRRLVNRITTLLIAEATADLRVVPFTVRTPLAKYVGQTLAQQVGFVPIIRAGLGMVHPALELVPTAQVWMLGLYRNEQTLQPVPYYCKLPAAPTADVYYILDPMLATGGSAVDAVRVVQKYGKPMKFVGLIAAPEGVFRLATEYPDIMIHIGALDSHLNKRGYIVPGLGDAGDRIFNT